MIHITDSQVTDAGIAVIDIAYDIFCRCDAEQDFCVQDDNVFGSTNRIVLTINGWRAEASHCTPDFIAKFRAITEINQ